MICNHRIAKHGFEGYCSRELGHPDAHKYPLFVVGGKTVYETTAKGLEFHLSAAANLLAEGERGTGKSHMMRWDAHMRAMSFPGYTYLLLRRTMPELKKSHLHFIDAEMKLLGGYYHKTDNIAVYPNGSKGYIGHCEVEADVLKYLSSQFCAIYFDELTTFEWEMYTKIAASARVEADKDLTAIVRTSTNPLGISAEDVHLHFISKDIDPLEDPTYNPNDWIAMHFTKEDNPWLDVAQYVKRFSGLPEAYRKAWLHGEWGVEGAYFDITPQHLLADLPLVTGPTGVKSCLEWPWIHIYRVFDYGYHDPSVCAWIAVLPNSRAIVFKEMAWVHQNAQQIAKDIREASAGMRVITTIADPTIWKGEKEMLFSMADIFENEGISLTKGMNDRTALGYAIQQYLTEPIKEGDLTFPKLTIMQAGCPTLIRALKAMRVDKKQKGRIADHKMDHLPIALGYFCLAGVGPTRVPKVIEDMPWLRRKRSHRILGKESVRYSRP